MSEVSILSAEFGALSKVVDQVNHSIIVLKTQAINNTSNDKANVVLELEDGELEHAVDYLKTFLSRLELLKNLDAHSPQVLPNDAVSQLVKTVIAENFDFFNRILSIQSSISKLEVLDTSQLELLDQIVEALDQERGELFKKLRAARG